MSEREKKMPIIDIKTVKQLEHCIAYERRELLLSKQKIQDYNLCINEIYYRAIAHKWKNITENFDNEIVPMKFFGLDVIIDNELKNYELRKKI